MAATFDPEVGGEYGHLMSEEWRAMGISMQVATQMDLATEPRWKRISGRFGEDPALSMDMARAVINGWQSTKIDILTPQPHSSPLNDYALIVIIPYRLLLIEI